ncbi:hypothetical protein [Alteriqipengyuania sp.]|uniref:hypothetical protein n=1 Tax=Alteriqipengyuania sp. TaxID=2800692 RepID=UPI003513FCA6
MADAIDSDTDQPIHYFEAFRRAKRNVLFWALVTFMLPLMQPIDDKDRVEVSTLGGEFDLWFLILMSLLILVFMAISFRQAAAGVTRRNAKVGVDARPEPLPDLNAEVRKRVDEIFARTHAAEEALNDEREAAKQEMSIERATAQSDAQHVRDHAMAKARFFDQQIEAIPAIQTWPGINRIDQEWIEIHDLAEHGNVDAASLEKLRKNLEKRLTDTFVNNTRQLNDFQDFLKQTALEIASESSIPAPQASTATSHPPEAPTLSKVHIMNKDVVVALDTFSSEFSEMREFSKKLYRSDKRYFDYFEVGLTWTAIIIAGSTAIFFLLGAANLTGLT